MTMLAGAALPFAPNPLVGSPSSQYPVTSNNLFLDANIAEMKADVIKKNFTLAAASVMNSAEGAIGYLRGSSKKD